MAIHDAFEKLFSILSVDLAILEYNSQSDI